MNRARTPRRPWLLILVLIGLAILGLALLLWYVLAGLLPKPGPPGPPGPPRPDAQPASCADVQLLVVPGTWESSGDDDPHNPTANPNALLLNVTRPIRAQFPESRVDVYTVPYVAQFSNPIALPPDGQQSYNKSRTEGAGRATDVLAKMHVDCPLSTYVLAGFSQGAVIIGDLAARIGAGDGPVPADQVLGVTLIADGRRVDGQATTIGTDPPGNGAEVALKGVNVPGISMTGPRDGGFGALAPRTNTICAPGDLICDAPRDALRPTNILGSVTTLIGAVGNPVHAMYASYVVDRSGTTATQWTAGWAAGLIDGAPHPAHL